MSDRIPLAATEETTLPALLEQNGIKADTDTLTDAWTATDNEPNHKRVPRPPYVVHVGDTWFVAAPSLPSDASLRTFNCTGSEKSSEQIVETIKAQYGEGAAEQLLVGRDRFTTSYLLGLPYNQAFRIKRSNGVPIAAGETLQYPTRRRTTFTLDTSPTTSESGDAKNKIDGTDPFIVEIKLDGNGQTMKLLEVVPKPETVDPHNPDAPVAAHFRPATGKVRFKVTITPRSGNIAPTGATIRVLQGVDVVYFSEERRDADWTKTGERIWEWDGYTTPPPAPGATDTGVADSRILRDRLTVEIIVTAATGHSRGALELDNRPAKAKFLDVRVDIANGNIEGFAYVQFRRAQEDAGIWLATLIGAGAVAGVVELGLLAGLLGESPWKPHGLTHEQQRNYAIAMGVAPAAVMGLFFGVVGAMLAATRLSDTEFEELKAAALTGITRHWQRLVLVDQTLCFFHANPVQRESGERIRYCLTSDAIMGGSCFNLNMGFIVLPNKIGGEHSEVAAHEFGHSIMCQTGSIMGWSMTHKGSSTIFQERKTGAGGFQRPIAPDNADIMIYYDDQGKPYSRANLFAAPVDVLGWVEICQIEFNEL